MLIFQPLIHPAHPTLCLPLVTLVFNPPLTQNNSDQEEKHVCISEQN